MDVTKKSVKICEIRGEIIFIISAAGGVLNFHIRVFFSHLFPLPTFPRILPRTPTTVRSTMSKPLTSKILNSTVIVAGLGYFVDIYDLQLFNIIGKESIQSPAGLNVSDPLQVANLVPINLFYWQMAGRLGGGLF